LVTTVRQIRSKCGIQSKLLRSPDICAIDRSTQRARIRTIASGNAGIEIQPHKYLIKQRIVFAAACPFEGVKEPGVVVDIRGIEIPVAIELQSNGTDVADIDVHVSRDISRHGKRKVLDVRRREIPIKGGNGLIRFCEWNRLQRLRRRSYWDLGR